MALNADEEIAKALVTTYLATQQGAVAAHLAGDTPGERNSPRAVADAEKTGKWIAKLYVTVLAGVKAS